MYEPSPKMIIKQRIVKYFILFLFFCYCLNYLQAQKSGAKERAAYLAREYFSKSKHKEKEKYGVTKVVDRVIVSTPAIKSINDYVGFYKVMDLGYELQIKINKSNNIEAILSHIDKNDNIQSTTILKDVMISDALFTAVKVNYNGDTDNLEGAFINKNDNGSIDFGLGIKFENSSSPNGLYINKLFFKRIK
jgi:hypothetical protein